MAALQERYASVVLTIPTIIGHIDHLYVALNHWDRKSIENITKEFSGHNVTFIDRKKNMGDVEKFAAFDTNSHYMSFDDDLRYSPQYFRAMFGALKDLPDTIITMHGRNMRKPFTSYYDRRCERYACLQTVSGSHWVQFGGTGCMLIPKNTLNVDVASMTIPNMADVWIGKQAKEAGVPIVVVPHKKGWISHNEIDLWRTIYSSWRPEKVDEIASQV